MSHEPLIGSLSFSTRGERPGALFATAGRGELAAVVTDSDGKGARNSGFVRSGFVRMTSRG